MIIRKPLILSLTIPALLALGIFGSLFAWSIRCEKRWLKLKAEAEAQGESFAWNHRGGVPVADQENLLMHPWVRESGMASPFRDWKEKNLAEDFQRGNWGDDSGSRETSSLCESEEAQEKFKELIERHEQALRQLSEAMSRRGCYREYPSWMERCKDPFWMNLSEWCCLLSARAVYYQKSNQRELFEKDLQSLKKAARHAVSQDLTLPLVIGMGIEATIMEIAKSDLKNARKSDKEKQLWIELLQPPLVSLEKQMLAAMRCERNGILQVMDTDLRQSGMLYGSSYYESFWQRNSLVQRALFASNRWMLCKDFQETLAGPDLMGQKIAAKNFSEFAKRVEEHQKADEMSGRIGLAPWIVLKKLYAGMEQIEIKRSKLLKKLSQS